MKTSRAQSRKQHEEDALAALHAVVHEARKFVDAHRNMPDCEGMKIAIENLNKLDTLK